jgi:glycosyltransferase involved in cell wall biosynthesis
MDVYAVNVAAALERVAPSFAFLMLRPGEESGGWLHKQVLRYFGYAELLRKTIRWRRCSFVHVLDQSSAYLSRAADKAVITCHDIADLKSTALNPWQLALWKWRIGGLRKAWRIVAVSQNTKADLEAVLGIPPERIRVIPNGVADCFSPSTAPLQHASARKLGELRKSHFLFLHVGSNAARKNISTLLRGFALVKRDFPQAILVKAGSHFAANGYQKDIAELGIGDSIIELGRIPDDELVEVYRSVDCFLFPSSYEGFGLPVLEAQACGVPCVLARSSSLEEVGGTAALYHDPSSAADLSARMIEILSEELLRADLRAKGLANAERFTWDNHASKLLEIYREAGADV